tara:strand:+ start:58 stop:300 length:243 start_codon:yes stop_codon:yes gene_type:complete
MNILLIKKTINNIARPIRMKYNLKMGIDGVIEPIYFLITSVGFVILSFIQYKKTGKTLETIYLSILAVFFIVCFIILNFY